MLSLTKKQSNFKGIKNMDMNSMIRDMVQPPASSSSLLDLVGGHKAVEATTARIAQEAHAARGLKLVQAVDLGSSNASQFLGEKRIKNPKVLSAISAEGKVTIKGGEKLSGFAAVALRVLETVFLPLIAIVALFSKTYRHHLDSTVFNGVDSKQEFVVSQPVYDATVMLAKTKIAHTEAKAKLAEAREELLAVSSALPEAREVEATLKREVRDLEAHLTSLTKAEGQAAAEAEARAAADAQILAAGSEELYM